MQHVRADGFPFIGNLAVPGRVEEVDSFALLLNGNALDLDGIVRGAFAGDLDEAPDVKLDFSKSLNAGGESAQIVARIAVPGIGQSRVIKFAKVNELLWGLWV